MLRTALIVISLLTLWYTARKIRKSQLQIEDSIFWMAFPAALVILSVFPGIATWAAKMLGVQSPVNFIFLAVIFILIVKIFSLFFADFSVGYENSNVNTGNCHSGKAAAGEKGKRHSSIGIKAKGG